MLFFGTLLRPVFAEKLEVLPLREIRASGWLRNQMIRDMKSGYISVYDQLQPTMQNRVFGPRKAKNYSIDKNGNWETRRETWWPGEHEGYFADIVVRNGFLANYQPWIEKGREIVDYVVAHQDSNGYIGIYDEECRLDHLLNENGELWTQSRILNALLAFYEFTGEKLYFEAARRAVDYTISRYEKSGKTYFQQPAPNGGGLTHGLMYVDVLEWLYRQTGEKRYLRFAEWLYADYSHAEPKLKNTDNQLNCLLNRRKMFQEHSVHVVEHFRMPFFLAAETGKREYREASQNIFLKLGKSTAPSGTIVMDPSIHESVAGNYGSPYLPYEYCTITETVLSYGSALQKSGQAWMADAIEHVTFNAGQGARLADGRAISYATLDNRDHALEKDGFRYQLGACHKVACCNLQAPKLLPSYISNSWMRSQDGKSLYLMLYGPVELRSRVKGIPVNIEQRTIYPMEESVTLLIDPASPVSFPLYLRIPEWASSFCIKADGAEVSAVENGFVRVFKKWQRGDRITLDFEAAVRITRWMNNELTVSRGPLVYAMKIEENLVPTKVLDHGFANFDVSAQDERQRTVVFDKTRLPANADLSNARDKSLYVYVKNPEADRDYPFDRPYGFIKGRFVVDGQSCTMRLVPMGSTVLRRVTFKETGR